MGARAPGRLGATRWKFACVRAARALPAGRRPAAPGGSRSRAGCVRTCARVAFAQAGRPLAGSWRRGGCLIFRSWAGGRRALRSGGDCSGLSRLSPQRPWRLALGRGLGSASWGSGWPLDDSTLARTSGVLVNLGGCPDPLPAPCDAFTVVAPHFLVMTKQEQTNKNGKSATLGMREKAVGSSLWNTRLQIHSS